MHDEAAAFRADSSVPGYLAGVYHGERGLIDLDERVTTYLPEFRLTTPGAAENTRVRNLLNHTNGIDADLFFVDASGRDALKVFVDELGQHCGTFSCTSAADAILRSTAVGHFPDLATGDARPTDMFMLPESWAPAGATPIGTIGDLLAFARTHLAGGVRLAAHALWRHHRGYDVRRLAGWGGDTGAGTGARSRVCLLCQRHAGHRPA